MKPGKENNGNASNPNGKVLQQNHKASNFGLNRTLKSLRLANVHQIIRCSDKSKEKDSNSREQSMKKKNDSFATFQKEFDSQKDTIDTKRLIKTCRKLQLSEAKISSAIPASFSNTQSLAMINRNKAENVSHIAGNCQQFDLEVQNKSEKDVKYDFEDCMNSRVTTQEESQLNLSNNFSSTIIVKEDELKRFTHKFAREKIEFEQQIEKLAYHIEELKEMNQQMESERKDFLSSLRAKENENVLLREEKLELLNRSYRTEQQQNQINTLLQAEVESKSETIKQLECLLVQKNGKIDEILFQLSAKEKEIEKLEILSQSKNSSFVNPSLTSSIRNRQNHQESLSTEQDVQFWKGECRKYEGENSEMSSCMSFLKIEIEHIQRELELEKETSSDLREQLRELKIFCEVERSMKQLSCQHVQQQNNSVFEQEEALIKKIEDLVCSKQTLQRSLQVSSEMILQLKKQNSKLKWEVETGGISETNQGHIRVEDVKKIIQTMMRDQLELQEQLTIKNKCHQSHSFLPVVINESLRLKRRFEEGYQSVKQIQRKTRYFKTERTESEDETANGKQSFVNEYKSLLDSHTHGRNHSSSSQRQSFFDKN